MFPYLCQATICGRTSCFDHLDLCTTRFEPAQILKTARGYLQLWLSVLDNRPTMVEYFIWTLGTISALKLSVCILLNQHPRVVLYTYSVCGAGGSNCLCVLHHNSIGVIFWKTSFVFTFHRKWYLPFDNRGNNACWEKTTDSIFSHFKRHWNLWVQQC